MRHAIAVTIMMILAGGTALAKGKDDDGKKGGGASMDSGDPANTETSDRPKPSEGEDGKPKGDKDDKGDKSDSDADEAAQVVVPVRARDKLVLFADILIGFGQAPVPGPTLTTLSYGYTGKTTAFTFMAGGRYDFSPTVSAGLRIPWTFGSERLLYGSGSGTSVRSQAFGAPELTGEYRVEIQPRLQMPLMIGIGIPIAQGDVSPYSADANAASRNAQRRLQYMADAASGYRDEELFDPKRLPIVLAGGIHYERQALQVHGDVKLIVPIQTSSAPPSVLDPTAAGGTFTGKRIAFREVTFAGLSYDVPVSPKVTLVPAADAWLAWKAINTIEYNSAQGATPSSRWQFVFEPRLGVSFSKKPKITPSIGYIFPIGGHLADGKVSALELHADFAF